MTPLAFWLRILYMKKIHYLSSWIPPDWLACLTCSCVSTSGSPAWEGSLPTWAISSAFDSGKSQDSSYPRCACAGGEHLNGFPLNFSRSHWATPGEAEQNCLLHHWVWGEVKKYGLSHPSNGPFSNDSPWLLSWSSALWEGIASH